LAKYGGKPFTARLQVVYNLEVMRHSRIRNPVVKLDQQEVSHR